MGEATPRINAQYLEQFTHQTVRIVGKLTSLQGENATLEANGPVQVLLNRVCLSLGNPKCFGITASMRREGFNTELVN